ncbi:MAG: hypothetical protein ACXVNN_04935 [Bacteroidia bacterium]
MAFSSAQIPGYMGKRFTIGIGNAISPNFNVLLKLDNPNSTYYGPTLTTALNIDYVYSERRVLSVSLRYLSRKAESDYYIDPYIKETNTERFNMINYSFGIKRFGKKSIAPVGFYTKIEGYFIEGWINYKSYSDLDRYTYNSLIGYPGGRINFKGAGGAYSVGKERIFFDKFPVDFGARATLMALFYTTNSSDHEKQLAVNATDPINFMPVFNIYIGIGFLAF